MRISRINDESLSAYARLIPEEVQDILADGGTYIGLGVEEDGYACGQMVAELDGQVVRIHSLYIDPSYRRRGFATELLIRMADEISRWETVYGYQITFSENLQQENGLKPFLEFCGFELEEEESRGCYSCTLGDIQTVWKGKRLPMNVIPYRELNKELLQQLRQEPPIALSRDITEERIEPDCSCVVEKKNHLEGCLMVEREADHLVLEWVRITPARAKELLAMFGYALEHAIEKYGVEQKLVIPVLNGDADRLLKRLTGDALVPMERCYHGTYIFDYEWETDTE